MGSILHRKIGEPTQIHCPYTEFPRAVAACLVNCELKYVNWCQQIKKVGIEELDEVSESIQENSRAIWQQRRDFFLSPTKGSRDDADSSFTEESHGGGGVTTMQELGITDDPKEEKEAQEEENFNLDDIPDEEMFTDPGEEESESPEGGEEKPEAEVKIVESTPEEEKEEEEDDDSGDDSSDDDTEEASEGDDDVMAKKNKCPHCGDEMDTERGLKIHIARKHKNAAKKQTEKAAKKKPTSKKTPAKKNKKAARVATTDSTPGYIVVLGHICCTVEEPERIPETIEEVQELSESDEQPTVYEIGREVSVTIRTEVQIDEA